MLSVIAVFAISAGILLAAQSGCIGATLAGTDGSYNTPDTGLSEHAPVQAVTAWEGMSNLIVACQIADTFADMLFTGMLDTAYAVHAVLSLTAADNITDDDTLVLGRAFDITTFVSGGHTYAAVTAEHDSGVQILNITNPSDITPTDSITDGGTLELRSAQSITTFESGDHIYAAVTAFNDNGVQILNITNPSDITPTDSITDGGTLKLRGAFGITTFESGDHIYAAVTALTDNSVQILDVTNPSNITPAGSITDDGTLELNNPRGITTFVSGDHIYAAVAAYTDDGVQILDVTNPSNITAAGSITDGDTLVLNGPRDIAIFESGSHIYAAVATHFNNGVQILNITNPSDITPAGSITDGGTLELSNPRGITTFVSGSHTYAAVAAYTDDGVQILDVTDPSNITAAGSITDIGNAVDDLELDGAYGITTFTSGGHTYVAVAAFLDDGVQIIRIDIPTTDTTPPVIKLEGSSLVTITVDDTYTEEGAVCDDDVDVDKAATVGGDTVDTSTVGQYTVTYDCTDTAGNVATQVLRTVNVQSAPDTDAPVIIITGSANIQLTVDDTYTEEGAVCDDDVDVDKAATVGGDTVDTSTVGQYTVTYDCTDTAGNVATQVLRTVNVQSAPDTDAPVIIITGSANIQLTVDETYTEQGAVCDDDVDVDKAATVGGDTVDTSTVGQYTVTYDCTDTAGNVATQVLRTVNVQSAPDTDAPVIIITGSANIQLTVDDTYTEEGAVCEDNVDADKAATVGGDTVDTSTVGQYTVTYDCTDSSNNDATQVSRTVTVIETGAPFITTWIATDSDKSITLPMKGTYSILWGDGSNSTNVSGSQLHTYGAAGNYTVTVLGDGLLSINLSDDTANARQLRSIEQWGGTEWTSMSGAFDGASNMVYNATDAPDLSGVTDMSYMFFGASSFNGDLSSWDVSKVTNMESMFRSAFSFNQPLNDWDVSAVTDMSSMFDSATAFDGDLSSWDVSAVTNMNRMFHTASSFNQTISSWDVSAVTDMLRMFYEASDFNQPLNDWDVSSVSEMGSMFYQAADFNQPLNAWDVSSVTDMSDMFNFATSFNQPLNSWDVSKVTGMFGMFSSASSFNQTPQQLGRLLCHRHVLHVLWRLLL